MSRVAEAKKRVLDEARRVAGEVTSRRFDAADLADEPYPEEALEHRRPRPVGIDITAGRPASQVPLPPPTRVTPSRPARLVNPTRERSIFEAIDEALRADDSSSPHKRRSF